MFFPLIVNFQHNNMHTPLYETEKNFSSNSVNFLFKSYWTELYHMLRINQSLSNEITNDHNWLEIMKFLHQEITSGRLAVLWKAP